MPWPLPLTDFQPLSVLLTTQHSRGSTYEQKPSIHGNNIEFSNSNNVP